MQIIPQNYTEKIKCSFCPYKNIKGKEIYLKYLDNHKMRAKVPTTIIKNPH